MRVARGCLESRHWPARVGRGRVWGGARSHTFWREIPHSVFEFWRIEHYGFCTGIRHWNIKEVHVMYDFVNIYLHMNLHRSVKVKKSIFLKLLTPTTTEFKFTIRIHTLLLNCYYNNVESQNKLNSSLYYFWT